ncbi:MULTISPECIES: M14 family metallopeptidase [unclassified Nocardioides]|uniref:M14 family metallopeptidase n=1 Tax=unclassified Nocardioides TaxID=2615069 RepID=UPI0007004115|nr:MULTISPECIES: M14 family metallopeptidase [unclassified Nocardioides]KRA31419.1 peptidase M14 [Nocardioides sp. Root614]KRA88039.1 peptidase M14 [Nocardioides sp. Root682]
MRRLTVPVALAGLVAGLLISAPLASTALPAPGGAPRPGTDDLEVYVVETSGTGIDALQEIGVDTDHVVQGKGANGTVKLETVITGRQAAKLRSQGLKVNVKKVHGKPASAAARAELAAGFNTFRSYSEPGGIADELRAAVAANPKIAKLVVVGHSLNGQQILGVKITKDARKSRDGSRPSVLYAGAQHAREWITTEQVRRLMHYFLDGYSTNKQLRSVVDGTELWFVPVLNPDGYDYTFSTNRLWRKNLRDNDGDHVITAADGVDPNRNYPTKWGWDNEGSSNDPASETYRGTGPASEPETQALDELFDRVDFEYLINYHSAAELLLYGIGWQVGTPSPDDVILEALAGDDAHSAIAGYDPDLSAELYTTNGETDGHATDTSGILSFTPEMSTCATASNAVADDEWLPEDCISVFNFPDDEGLIQAEFTKNLPFALSLARSAKDPDDPVSSIGRTATDLVADPFPVSYGTTQKVAVIAKRALTNKALKYSVNGGPTRTAPVTAWAGGERYGDTGDTYYAEFRGTVTGTAPGNSVKVWFTGVKGKKTVSSVPFTYTVANDIGGDVLILAAEDVTGLSPAQGVTNAKYADAYAAALSAAGYSSDVYDVDVNGRTAPHHLGVLGHYDAIVWESGDDVVTRAVGQVAGTADDLAQQLEITVRDYLNEGGKALVTGQYNQFAQATNGSFWFNPFAPPECTTPGVAPCVQLFNDFQQYWLGAYNYVSDGGTDDAGNPFAVSGAAASPFDGFTGTFNGGDSADNQRHTGGLVSTSSVLPAATFPQFASSAPLDWDRPGAAPYDPHAGDWYLFSQNADQGFKRLDRTIDLTGATSASLEFAFSFDTERDWDYVMVEAREVGTDNWTTLPDANGHTDTYTGESCPEGWVVIHPQLAHYQGADCSSTGSTGTWNAASGNSGGWQDWDIDLSSFAGKSVEVSISYVTDWGTEGLGAFVDDAKVVVDGSAVHETSFEGGLDGWTVPAAPAGSRQTNTWLRTQEAFDEGAATVTDDSVFTGFGTEGLTTQAQRNDFVAKVMSYLLD